jgi:small subunit ribosomal protein S2
MPSASMRQLLEAGVHFGHQTRRWNPKMRPFIFAERNGIHIIDLAQTAAAPDVALQYVTETTARGDGVLFVGTKKQAQEPIAEEATRAGQPYVNQRWLGGMLTNFVTIKKRLALLEQLEARQANGDFERMSKKEASRLTDEMTRLQRTVGGMRKMKRLPGAVFIVDPHREHIATVEARKLEIPVIGTGDTNVDPDELDTSSRQRRRHPRHPPALQPGRRAPSRAPPAAGCPPDRAPRRGNRVDKADLRSWERPPQQRSGAAGGRPRSRTPERMRRRCCPSTAAPSKPTRTDWPRARRSRAQPGAIPPEGPRH